MTVSANLEVRCYCRRSPLLAVCGRDTKTGDLYVHVRSAKKDRLNTEVVITSGTVRVRCRDCLRWHTVRISPTNIDHKPEPLPATINL